MFSIEIKQDAADELTVSICYCTEGDRKDVAWHGGGGGADGEILAETAEHLQYLLARALCSADEVVSSGLLIPALRSYYQYHSCIFFRLIVSQI